MMIVEEIEIRMVIFDNVDVDKKQMSVEFSYRKVLINNDSLYMICKYVVPIC